MKFTREQCLKWAEEAGFYHFYYRGDQQYHTALIEALCTLVWNAAIEEARKACYSVEGNAGDWVANYACAIIDLEATK